MNIFSFVKDVLATLQRNEDPPWRFLGESLNPAPPPPNYVKVLEQDPRPPPPNTFYQQHMMPYYVFQYPGRGEAYAYGIFKQEVSFFHTQVMVGLAPPSGLSEQSKRRSETSHPGSEVSFFIQ
ncbi:hypothetical protein NQZ68_006128 [Dissostichus eleginoides]|nr:hypothetical protein NQZ68_006128 [Dissostichus eleginoides]